MIWLVALGSAIGGVLRFLLVPVAQRWFATGFPGGTLAVNILGSLAIGLIVRLAAGNGVVTPEARVFLAIGVCGGFTTFSSFSLETVELLQSGQFGRAAAYVTASLLCCLLATLLGWFGAGLFTPRLTP